MADVFLLTESEQKYFTNLTTAFANAVKAEGLTSDSLELTEEQLLRIAGKLPYSQKNIMRKWDAVMSRPFFMLMVVQTYKPAPPKPDSEPLANDEFFLKGFVSEKRYTVSSEWHCLRGDNLDPVRRTPIADPIEKDSTAYNLINNNREIFDGDAETMAAIRNALGLSEYSYIPVGVYASITTVVAVCKEYLKLPHDPNLSQGRRLTIETSLQALPSSAAAYFGDGFSSIRQGVATNTFATVKPSKGNTQIDEVTKTATITTPIKGGSLILTIPEYDQLTGLKTSTHQLLDALVIDLTESGAKSTTVILSLSDYMKRRGLKDRKEARRQFTADLNVLLSTSITLAEDESTRGEDKESKKNKKKKILPIKGMNITDSWEWADKKKTAIAYTFGQAFYKVLLGYPVMPYPAQLQTLNAKKNPNSYFLLRKISEQKNMNVFDINHGDIISVETLLSVSPYIPSYEEVMKGNRNTLNRIIEPFERDMDALSDTLKWEYCHSKGTPLTKTERDSMTYDIFKGLLVKIEWTHYPDQSARLERKTEQIEQSKHEKPATSKKKTRTAE